MYHISQEVVLYKYKYKEVVVYLLQYFMEPKHLKLSNFGSTLKIQSAANR